MSEPSRHENRTWLYVGVAFVVFWGVYLAVFNRGGADVPRLEGSGLDLPADYGWALEDLDGKAVSLADFRGRPIVLNIWATWCPPCRAEMPSLARLSAEARLKGVAFICVTNERATPAVKRYAAEAMRGLTVLRADATPDVFASDGIPATFVIDPGGRVVSSVIGAASWDDPSVVSFLEGLLKKPETPRS